MTRTIRRKKTPRRRRPRYSPAEWFMVVLGAAILILIAGIIITSILG
jgi:hypothetical protein